MPTFPDARPDSTPPPVAVLAGGIRFVAIPLPQRRLASVGVYVRAGSAVEPRALNGISHVVEHMVFKGTATRDVARINLDAESLGAEVDAHTDKDHTAFTLRGRPEHAERFVELLADLVRHAVFPEAELARERTVLLQEEAEVADDPIDTAWQLFDHACWGLHAAAQPVIGSRGAIARLQRTDLARWVERHYGAANIVVAAAGAIRPDALARAVEAAFAGHAAGTPTAVDPPAYAGGVRSRRLSGSSQTHFVVGWPGAARGDDDVAAELAAAVVGEGMSSPLLAELREKRGLVYHAHCSADRFEGCGQFAIEASTAPEHLEVCLREATRIVSHHAARVAAVDLDRARHQLAVRLLGDDERPAWRMEQAALDLFALGRVRAASERYERAAAMTATEVAGVFATMLGAGPALALSGSLGRAAGERAREWLRG